MDRRIFALDTVSGIKDRPLNNSGQPAGEDWIRASGYVRLQKNLIPVCYFVSMHCCCYRVASCDDSKQSHTWFHKASPFWGIVHLLGALKLKPEKTIRSG
jgi:hypothetical protein